MPGPLLANPRSGNRAEYFAQYVLSALGVSSPVPRPEDIGIDFHCALAHNEGHLLFFEHTFGVQVGTIGSKEFRYGVSRKRKQWKFKPYETAWLFSQSLPLFVATVDQKSLTFRLYSTSPMWIRKYLVGEPAEIILAPDEYHNPETGVLQEKLLPEGFGDRRTYRIPLFAPVVELCQPLASLWPCWTYLVEILKTPIAEVNISDPREMVELLREMMTNILEEISDLPQRVTANPEWIDGGDAVPLAEDDGGPTDEGAASCS